MSIHMLSAKPIIYPIGASSNVTATVIIGDGQGGGWTVAFDDKLRKGSDSTPMPVGAGAAITDKVLQVVVTAVDIRKETNRLSTVLRLSGGSVGDMEVPQSFDDGSDGDVAVFTTLVLFQ